MAKSRVLAGVAAAVLAGMVWAEETQDGKFKAPVSGAGNPFMLGGLEERPWRFEELEYRVPLLVCEMSTNRVANHAVDAVVDLGRKAAAGSVRVATASDEEVACSAVSEGGNRVRLHFMTNLRPAENKAFFVYFSEQKREGGKKAAAPGFLRLEEIPGGLRMANGELTAEFSRSSKMANALMRFKINSSISPNELQTMADGTAGGVLTPEVWGIRDKGYVWTNRLEVTCDNPFKKAVRMSNDIFDVEYTMYEGAGRLDYRMRAKDAKRRRIMSVVTGWASGGGTAWDDIYYPSISGKVRTMRGGLDYRSDSGGELNWTRLGEFCGEGWYMIRDRNTKTGVGQFYSPEDTAGLRHDFHGDWGKAAWMRLGYYGKRVEEMRGALFGGAGDWELVRRA